jgi:hypothetical protein
MRRKIKAGLTSLSLPVIVYDTASTTGGGLSGLTHTTSGLILEYRRQGQSSWTQLGVGTGLVSKTLGTYVSGGIVASGSRAGRYEIDIPDAAIAAGARMVEVCLRGAANMHPVDIEIELDAVDYQTDAFGALKPTTAGRTLDVSAGGEAGIDLANVGSPSTTLNLSGTTIKTATDIETDTQDIQNRLPAALVDGRMASIAQVVGDKTAYKLASDGLTQVTSWTVAITGNITGNVTGSVGSISGVTFPANFGLLVIDPSGIVDTVGRVLELDENALIADSAGDPIAGIVWNALTTATWATNSFGKHVLISNNNNRSVQVTGSGSGHIAADIHALQAGVVTSAAFSANWFTAAGLAADAATEIATAVAGIQSLSRLDSMIEDNGSGQFRFDTIALEMAPAGGGGGGTDWTANERTAIRSILGIPTSGTTPTDPTSGILDEIRDDINAIGINVYPVSASTPERVQGTTLTLYRNESRSVSVVTDFTLTSLTLQFTVEDADGVDVYTLANGSISRSGQTFTVAVTTAVTGNLGQYRWSMRDISSGGSSVVAMGVLTVQEAASNV